MTTFNTALPHYTPAAGKGIPYDHITTLLDNTLALKQGDKAHDFLVALQLDVTDTGTKNDYNPGTGAVVRWNGASAATVTGIVAHADGDIRIFQNVTAAQLLTFTNQDAGSSAANRIILASASSLVIPPGGSVAFYYETTADRWRVLVVNLYDEGAWTPTIVSSGGGTPTYTTNAGKYTKVGRRVSFSARINLSAFGTLAAGNITIAGLPYASENTAGNASAVDIGYWFAMTTAIVNMTGFIQANASIINMNIVTVAATGVTTMTKADLGATTDLILSGHYNAAV